MFGVFSSDLVYDNKPLLCKEDADVNSDCIIKITNIPKITEQTNFHRYTLLKTFGGGKSGAYVYLVKDSETDVEYVIKFYTDAYKKDNKTIFNERPFREVSTLCALSGTEGFPCIYDYGKSYIPFTQNPKKQVGLFVIMSKASGTELSNLDLKKLQDKDLKCILLKLLILLDKARQVMGNTFEHFDFHTDNIFIDVDKVDTVNLGNLYTVVGPSVYIIDFDLVNSDHFKDKSMFKDILDEHIGKQKYTPGIAERTMEWAMNYIGIKKLLNEVQQLQKDNIQNTDTRHWYIMLSVFKSITKYKGPIYTCQTIDECIYNNRNFFKELISKQVKRTGANPYSICETQPGTFWSVFKQECIRLFKANTNNQITLPELPDKSIIKKDNMLSLFLKSETSARTWSDFSQATYLKHQLYPTPDTTLLLLPLLLKTGKNNVLGVDIGTGTVNMLIPLYLQLEMRFKSFFPIISLVIPNDGIELYVSGVAEFRKFMKLVSSIKDTYTKFLKLTIDSEDKSILFNPIQFWSVFCRCNEMIDISTDNPRGFIFEMNEKDIVDLKKDTTKYKLSINDISLAVKTANSMELSVSFTTEHTWIMKGVTILSGDNVVNVRDNEYLMTHNIEFEKGEDHACMTYVKSMKSSDLDRCQHALSKLLFIIVSPILSSNLISIVRSKLASPINLKTGSLKLVYCNKKINSCDKSPGNQFALNLNIETDFSVNTLFGGLIEFINLYNGLQELKERFLENLKNEKLGDVYQKITKTNEFLKNILST